MEKTKIAKRAAENEEEFIRELLKNYQSVEREQGNILDFLRYLLSKNIIPANTQLRYLIGSKYPEVLIKKGGVKRQAVIQLEAETGIPEPTVRHYIAKFPSFFPKY